MELAVAFALHVISDASSVLKELFTSKDGLEAFSCLARKIVTWMFICSIYYLTNVSHGATVRKSMVSAVRSNCPSSPSSITYNMLSRWVERDAILLWHTEYNVNDVLTCIIGLNNPIRKRIFTRPIDRDSAFFGTLDSRRQHIVTVLSVSQVFMKASPGQLQDSYNCVQR